MEQLITKYTHPIYFSELVSTALRNSRISFMSIPKVSDILLSHSQPVFILQGDGPAWIFPRQLVVYRKGLATTACVRCFFNPCMLTA